MIKNSYLVHGSVGNVFITKNGILPISLKINVIINDGLSIFVNYNHYDASSFLFELIPGRDIFISGFPRKVENTKYLEIDAVKIDF